mmetsp:Transcript_4865/g.7220  ORF Transcript_4865/g.7220 Transcript_4865/m.7220 type:complete len:168 (+) Transcript_4865:17-520(+)
MANIPPHSSQEAIETRSEARWPPFLSDKRLDKLFGYDRKQHCMGRKHLENVYSYYNQLGLASQKQLQKMMYKQISNNPFGGMATPRKQRNTTRYVTPESSTVGHTVSTSKTIHQGVYGPVIVFLALAMRIFKPWSLQHRSRRCLKRSQFFTVIFSLVSVVIISLSMM